MIRIKQATKKGWIECKAGGSQICPFLSQRHAEVGCSRTETSAQQSQPEKEDYTE